MMICYTCKYQLSDEDKTEKDGKIILSCPKCNSVTTIELPKRKPYSQWDKP